MNHEMIEHVSGLSDEQVTALADEAEAGYDLGAREEEPNPHFRRLEFLPDDLVAAIDERARQEGTSPEAVVREALSAYLRSA